MINLRAVPDGYDAIVGRYGDPDVDKDYILDRHFVNVRLTTMATPYPMRLSWKPAVSVKAIQCHIAVAASLVDALTEIRDYKGEGYLYDNCLDYWGGCFNFRPMRGYPALSTHSWGIAVDVCPQLGRFGNREDLISYPKFIVDAFRARGWDWGGAWPLKYHADGMHFQAARGY
jgi:hypothetical protein